MSPFSYTQDDGHDEEEGLMAGKFPYMNWASQAYNEWLARNTLNLTGQVAIGTIQTVASAQTGYDLGVINGLSNTLNVAKQIYEHKMLPDSAKGNINGADVNTANKQNGFYFYKKSINREFARIIDDFFTKYGYKVNRIKTPNIFGRQFYNYVKTIDAIVEGDTIPEKYLNEYREMLNKGVTFWHVPTQFLNYDVNNTIV